MSYSKDPTINDIVNNIIGITKEYRLDKKKEYPIAGVTKDGRLFALLRKENPLHSWETTVRLVEVIDD